MGCSASKAEPHAPPPKKRASVRLREHKALPLLVALDKPLVDALRSSSIKLIDADRIREWWEQIPDANIGIATGHGFFVVDLDGPAAALWADANELPDTLTAITAKKRRASTTSSSTLNSSSSIHNLSPFITPSTPASSHPLP